jgi:glucose-1-phosphate thymidylyltransferase
MLAGIREIAIITRPEDSQQFRKLLGSGEQFGVNFNYLTQSKPEGLAQAFLIAEEHIFQSECALILGDNIFHGAGLGRDLTHPDRVRGGLIFGTQVTDPSRYGVVRLNKRSEPLEIVEKPENFISDVAIPGLYFFDENVSKIAKTIAPSKRGELEITSIINSYLEDGLLTFKRLSRGTAWFDSGSFEGLHDANTYIRLVQERQNLQIGNLVEIGWRNGWVTNEALMEEIRSCEERDSTYLQRLLNE